MSFEAFTFLVLSAFFLAVIYLCYREIYKLEKVRDQLIDRSQRDYDLIARYEIAIQSLPSDLRYKTLQRVHRPSPLNEREEL